MELISNVSTWYAWTAVAWSVFQGARGVGETRINNAHRRWRPWQKIVVLDIHDFAFRATCTAAGFVALFVAYRVASEVERLGQIAGGDAALLVSAFLLGVAGVGGQLHHLVLLGRLPR